MAVWNVITAFAMVALSRDTTPCKVTPVILHGVVSSDAGAPVLHQLTSREQSRTVENSREHSRTFESSPKPSRPFPHSRLLTGMSMALSNVITAFALVALGLLACVLFAVENSPTIHSEYSRPVRNIPEHDPRSLTVGDRCVDGSYPRLLTGVSMALSNVITAFVLVALGLLACVLFATMGGENFSKQMQGTPMLGLPLPLPSLSSSVSVV